MQPRMIPTCERLAEMPLAFQALTGLTPAGFGHLLSEVRQAHDAAERDRRSRQPAPGAGHPHSLPLAERLLLTLVYLRHRPEPFALGVWFGVGRTTTWRLRQSVMPLLAAGVRDKLLARTPDEARRREIDAALAEMPELKNMSGWFRWADKWEWTMPPRRAKRRVTGVGQIAVSDA